jgi:hypothetical protein
MELALKESHRTGFSQRLPALAPWMHAFKFGPRLYTGHFKYDGVGNTWVNEQSPDGEVEQLQRAYDRFVAGDEWSQFLRSLLTTGTTASALAGETLIDIGSAAGRNSLLAVDCGVGAVTAVEIRENQAAQLASILDAVADDRYRERVRAVHDPLSADDPAYGEKYAQGFDVAMSLGILYHLANPWQHLLNLRRIARRRAILYTMTHQYPLAKRMWFMTPEDPAWITKATSGVSWTPHYWDVTRLCREAGFRQVRIAYPPRFVRYFKSFDQPPSRGRDAAQLAALAWHRITGQRVGAVRNHDFEYFRHHAINPNYFAYVCEV